jgi:hypothetical protein
MVGLFGTGPFCGMVGLFGKGRFCGKDESAETDKVKDETELEH